METIKASAGDPAAPTTDHDTTSTEYGQLSVDLEKMAGDWFVGGQTVTGEVPIHDASGQIGAVVSQEHAHHIVRCVNGHARVKRGWS